MANQAATSVRFINQANGSLRHFVSNLAVVKGVIDMASVATGAAGTDTGTITATGSGIALGDVVLGVSCSVSVAGLSITADVTATDVITVRALNLSGGAVDLASATFTVIVAKVHSPA